MGLTRGLGAKPPTSLKKRQKPPMSLEMSKTTNKSRNVSFCKSVLNHYMRKGKWQKCTFWLKCTFLTKTGFMTPPGLWHHQVYDTTGLWHHWVQHWLHCGQYWLHWGQKTTNEASIDSIEARKPPMRPEMSSFDSIEARNVQFRLNWGQKWLHCGRNVSIVARNDSTVAEITLFG